MALVLGTNSGFVTTAPTADPTGEGNLNVDSTSVAFRDTSPVGAIKVTEIGWWCDNATEEADFEVGIYSHDSGPNEPLNRIGVSSPTAKGTTSGWKTVTGLDIDIDPSTVYWIATQLDNTATTTTTDRFNTGASKRVIDAGETSLRNPWNSVTSSFNQIVAFYAVVEVSAGVTRKIKIAGTFQDKPIKTKVGGTFVDKPIKIKIGGTFQDA